MIPTVNFFNEENMGLFWGYCKSLLSTAAPGVLIVLAVMGVGMLITIIIKAFKEATKEDKDDDYEYREY
jgi:hypothetical protein